MPETDDYSSSDQPVTLGQRLLRTRGAAAVEDDPTGEPSTGATPNTQEPHQQTGAAAGDSAAQAPASGKRSIGQRMLMGSSQPTDGITAHNNDGSPADTTTGTDASGRPTISIKPAAAAPSPTAGATPATAPTIGQRLANFRPPPAAPQLDPNYSATQESVRKDSVVTPKVDAQGNTLQQYKPGFGTRLLRGVSDFMSGGIPGALQGAIDPRAPGFYGKGAVNNQYTKDEIARTNRLNADKAAVSSMDDEYSQKEKGYGHELTSYHNEAVAAGKADTDEIRQKYQTDLNNERTAHNTETENLRQQNNDLKDPQNQAAARAKLADQNGVTGKERASYVLTGKLPDEETTAEKLRQAEEKIGIMRDRAAIEKEKADNAKAKNSATFKDPASIDKYSDQWYLKQRDQVRKDKAEALKNAGGNADKAQDDYKEIENSYNQKTAEFEKRKAGWYDSVKGGKPVTVKDTDQGIPDTDSPTAVPASKDSDGQPLAAIPAPIASVRTGAPAPQQKPSPATPGAKSISKADVQALAQKHGLSYEDAAKQFTGKGYVVN